MSGEELISHFYGCSFSISYSIPYPLILFLQTQFLELQIMTTASPPQAKQQKLSLPSIPWAVTFGYLVLMLLIPTVALLLKTFTLSPAEIWKIATSPIALSAYNVSFLTAVASGVVNGIAGLIIAWVLVRYDFPFKRIVDALLDLPFALPTAVAGLTLATVYSEKGWIGSLLAPFGIKIAFTRWGVFLAMLFISLPFVVRTGQPVL
ncbi:MAG TPA: hypothetical protein V6C65_18000, partial [Allocoleopsis sp.]